MKNSILLFSLTLLLLFTISCANKAAKNPIVATESLAKTSDYSDLSADILWKQIKAHYDLEQYEQSHDKITALLNQYPNSPESQEAEQFIPQLDEKLKLKKIALKQAVQDSLKQERAARIPNALEEMRETKLSSGKSLYLDQSSPEFGSKECFYAYFTKSTGNPKLYFKTRYVSSSALGITNIVVTVDQADFELKGAVEETRTAGKKKLVIESMDIAIDTPEKIEMLREIALGNSITVAYVGSSSYKTRTISKDQQIAIRNVLDAYEFFGGTAQNL